MENQPTTSVIERAFQLARSGQYASIEEIRLQLTREDYETVAAVRGTALSTTLGGMIKSSRAARPG